MMASAWVGNGLTCTHARETRVFNVSVGLRLWPPPERQLHPHRVIARARQQSEPSTGA
jgi:hypothetical protein